MALEMTPDELRRLRYRTGMGVVEFGRALGYVGSDNSLSVQVRQMERGRKPIMPKVASHALAIRRFFDAIDAALASGGHADPVILLRELDRSGYAIVAKAVIGG